MPDAKTPQETARPGTGQPEEWRDDLNPDFMAGENYGTQGPQPGKTARTAYDVKGAHELLRDMQDDELKQIPVLAAGSRLEQGATYVDLSDPDRREFTATAQMEAGQNNWFAPKAEVPYWLWNRLIGVQNPERLDQADGT